MSEQLKCEGCGFSNEPERVYCHNCGAKLDRSLLPVVEDDKKDTSTEAARRRIKRMTNPSRFSPGQILKKLIVVVLWAVLAAAVILIARQPEGVPDSKEEASSRLVQSELMEAVQSPTPRSIAFSEADVNTALKQSLKRAANGGGAGIDFQRVYAVLSPDVIHIGTEQSFFGYPVFSGVDYRLTVVDGKFTPILLGGNLGRLPIHVEVMKYLDFAFQKLWTALKREHDQMNKMQNVTIGSGRITFVTKGGQ